MKKKLTAVILSLIFSCSALAGCTPVEPDNVSEPESSSSAESSSPAESLPEPESSSSEEESSEPESSSESEVSEEISSEETSSETEKPVIPEITSDQSLIKYKAVAAVGNSAYEYYGYVPDKAAAYTGMINSAAADLAGVSDVYSIIIPTSVGITLPDKFRDDMPGGRMEEPMHKLYDAMSDQVKQVKLYDLMMEHRNEYIYFRTDHHWTALGAYYAYTEFCRTKGIVPHALSEYELKEYEGFLGSFYKDTGNSAALGNSPDVLQAYLPVSPDIKLNFTTKEGKSYDWPIIADGDQYSSAMKYNIFAASDNPYIVVKNPAVTDGSSCVVVKESFGNALVPFLADHYSTIYEVDYRYWNGKVVPFAKEHQIDDVIFANNISMTRSGILVSKLARVFE